MASKRFLCIPEFCVSYHERKYDGCGLDALDEPHDDWAHDLDAGEDVNAECLDVTQVHVVRLVLVRHEQNQNALDKLATEKRHIHSFVT